MAKLFLLRHLKSQWNYENRFTGWVDVPVSKEGAEQAGQIANELKTTNFDVVYSAVLVRCVQTVIKIFKNLGDKYPLFKYFSGRMKKWGSFKGDGNYVEVYVTDKLNERSYGDLQGLDKAELKVKYGEEKIQLWRRSFNVAPPGGESGRDVYKRVIPFFQKYIEKDLKAGKNVLVVASHNSLRVIVKYIEKMSDEDFGEFDMAFGALIKYDFNGKSYSHLQ